jgi:aminoglycoside 6-adenylyltransferase
MDQMASGYERLTRQFVDWAQNEADIRAAMVIGSRARVDHPADEWADLDIVIFATTPQRYIASADWIGNIGETWLTFLERTTDGGWERRVLFADGYDIDFVINAAQQLESVVNTTLPLQWIDVLRRGYRILLDKDGLLAKLQRIPLSETSSFQPPTETDFLNTVHDFWYHAVWTTKHLRRGELWWAKSGCDEHLKMLLRHVLEWHAQAVHGPDHDTWMRGRFLEEWADQRAVQELPHIFAHYDQKDIARALLRTMSLFRWLAVEVAQRLGYSYPEHGEQAATALVKRYLKEITGFDNF